MFVFMCDKILNWPAITACTENPHWGVCTYCAVSGCAFFHQLFWRSIKVSSPNVWACVGLNIFLDLVRGRNCIIFITMSGVTGNGIDGISPPFGLMLKFFEPNSYRCPVEASFRDMFIPFKAEIFSN